MELEYKNIDFEVKADGDGNTIIGYGSIFGNVDRGGDIVLPGAFSKSLAAIAASADTDKIVMLWQHDSHMPIGVWDSVEEDEKGLKVSGTLAANVQKALEAKELIKMGAIKGLSIGFRTVEAFNDTNGNRLIKEAELWEISVVTFPMNESATIDAIKAAGMTKTEVERFLTGAGMSRSVAKGLIAKGYAGFSQDTLREAEEKSDELDKKAIEAKQIEELKELLNGRKNLLK